MKIAFIHYHLKTGGVTTVLKQQVEAIRDLCEILVLTGEPPDSPFPGNIVHIPGLGYNGLTGKPFDPEDVTESIISAIFSKWKNGCDILHVHNPTLAKNKHLLKILKALQKRNIRLFLQIHDFAEDGRPLLYFSEQYASDCHYGVINSRDYEILLKAGLKEEGLHKIFNTIKHFDFKQKDTIQANRVLYPIRAIRRKNIGEAILLSLFFKQGESLDITLPPNSPSDIRSYKGWKTFVKDKNLNVKFDTGLKNDFGTIVLSSRFLITTSITEGFGFSFLEPWTAKKLLWGRKLAGICHDFEKMGIQLDHLYTSLFVPLEWIGKEKFFNKWESCILKTCTLLNCNISKESMEKSFTTITKNDTIDFGLLDESLQKEIISSVLSGKKNADRLVLLNPYLSHPGNIYKKETLIQNNMHAVLSNYNKMIYREKLLEVYSGVINTCVSHSIDKDILLSEFLNLNNFSLLKWSEYVE